MASSKRVFSSSAVSSYHWVLVYKSFVSTFEYNKPCGRRRVQHTTLDSEWPTTQQSKSSGSHSQFKILDILPLLSLVQIYMRVINVMEVEFCKLCVYKYV